MKRRKPELSIVIPVYNSKNILEAGCIALQGELKKTGKSFEIIYCSDCSPDKPMPILRKLAKTYKNVRVFEHCANKGLGFTLRKLFTKAKGEFIIYMDADTFFTTDLSVLPRLLDHLKRYDVVVGDRYFNKRNEIPLARVAGSHAFFLANRLLFGIKVRDTGSGLAIYRKGYLDKLKLISDRFEIHTELYTRLQRAGAKAIEIPVNYKHWSGGSFNIWKHSWETIRRIVRVWFLLNLQEK